MRFLPGLSIFRTVEWIGLPPSTTPSLDSARRYKEQPTVSPTVLVPDPREMTNSDPSAAIATELPGKALLAAVRGAIHHD
jgi:hypothetical protein